MNLLYIEDNRSLAITIKNKLSTVYNVELAYSGKQCFKKIDNKDYDLFIIDYYLPDTDGLKICQKIREWDIKVPILMLTSNETKRNIIEALDAGADDYLTKPFLIGELNARIRALLRRSNCTQTNKDLVLRDLTIDTAKLTVICNKQTVDLPRQELLLLRYLIAHKNKLISRQELFEHVWGRDDYYNSNTIDVHIRRLRKKLKTYSDFEYIKSVYGLGYRVEL